MEYGRLRTGLLGNLVLQMLRSGGAYRVLGDQREFLDFGVSMTVYIGQNDLGLPITSSLLVSHRSYSSLDSRASVRWSKSRLASSRQAKAKGDVDCLSGANVR